MHISLLLNYVSCLGSVDDPTSFRMAGGLVSASIALILFIGLKSVLTGYRKSLAIVLVVVAITQFTNMILETFANDFYMNSGGIMTGINTLMAMMMLFFLIQRHSLREYTITETGYEQVEPRSDEHEKAKAWQEKDQEVKEIPQSIFKRSITDIIKGRKPVPIRKFTQNLETTSYASLDLLDDDEGYEYEEDEDEWWTELSYLPSFIPQNTWKGVKEIMATGLEIDFYKDIHQMKLSLGEINKSLQGIAKSLKEKNELEKNKWKRLE